MPDPDDFTEPPPGLSRAGGSIVPPSDRTIEFTVNVTPPAPTAEFAPDEADDDEQPILVSRDSIFGRGLPPDLELSREAAEELWKSLGAAIAAHDRAAADDRDSGRRNYGSLLANERLNDDSSADEEPVARPDPFAEPADREVYVTLPAVDAECTVFRGPITAEQARELTVELREAASAVDGQHFFAGGWDDERVLQALVPAWSEGE